MDSVLNGEPYIFQESDGHIPGFCVDTIDMDISQMGDVSGVERNTNNQVALY